MDENFEVVIWSGAVWTSEAPIHLADLVMDDDLPHPLTPTLGRQTLRRAPGGLPGAE